MVVGIVREYESFEDMDDYSGDCKNCDEMLSEFSARLQANFTDGLNFTVEQFRVLCEELSQKQYFDQINILLSGANSRGEFVCIVKNDGTTEHATGIERIRLENQQDGICFLFDCGKETKRIYLEKISRIV